MEVHGFFIHDCYRSPEPDKNQAAQLFVMMLRQELEQIRELARVEEFHERWLSPYARRNFYFEGSNVAHACRLISAGGKVKAVGS